MDEQLRINTAPLCIISKGTFGEHAIHDIQTSSAWTKNPYGEDYAIVPSDMVDGIMETHGFCDIELNEDGTEIIGYTARELPDIVTLTIQPSQLDIIEAQVTYTAMMTDTLLEV